MFSTEATHKEARQFSQNHPKTKIIPTFRWGRSVFYCALYPKTAYLRFFGQKIRTVTFYQNYCSYVAKECNFDKMHTLKYQYD